MEKKAFHDDCLEDSEKLTEKDFVDMLISVIKDKSHYRDALLEALKTLSNLVLDKNFFEKNLKEKIDKSLIDALFNANENYLEDLPVSSEINNLLCVICIRSDELAKYIVEKGGLQNIIEEIRSLIKLNDPVSQSKKLFGLKFIESLVKDEENMQKFVQLKGADLVLNLMNSCIQFQDEQNSKKIDELKNSENSQIIKHNNFVVRNSVFPGKQVDVSSSSKSINNSFKKGKENDFDSGLENGFASRNQNALGAEIIEDLKNRNTLNASRKSENYDFNNENKNDSSEVSAKLDCLACYITETQIKIYESKNFSNSKSEINNSNYNNKKAKSDENNAEVSDANSQNNSTLNNSNAEVNSSFEAKEDENINLNDDFFSFEEIRIKNENLDDIESTLNNESKEKNNFIPYLVYCFKIIQLNLRFKMKDFIDPRLFSNVVQLLK